MPDAERAAFRDAFPMPPNSSLVRLRMMTLGVTAVSKHIDTDASHVVRLFL
jgi:hypothetical protein